jgi:hypothetical protein
MLQRARRERFRGSLKGHISHGGKEKKGGGTFDTTNGKGTANARPKGEPA